MACFSVTHVTPVEVTEYQLKYYNLNNILSFEDEDSSVVHHHLVSQTNLTLKAVAYGKQLYARDCPRQIRILDKDEKAKLLSNGQLYVDRGVGEAQVPNGLEGVRQTTYCGFNRHSTYLPTYLRTRYLLAYLTF